MKRILSLLLLFPLALNAMEEERGEQYLGSLTPSYFASILDNNKKQYPRRGESADGTHFGDYAVKATWKFDNIAKIATATYTVKKGETLLDDTTSLFYNTAVLRQLQNGSYLRLSANNTGDAKPLKEVMYDETH